MTYYIVDNNIKFRIFNSLKEAQKYKNKFQEMKIKSFDRRYDLIQYSGGMKYDS